MSPSKPFSFYSVEVGRSAEKQALPEGLVKKFVTLLRDGKIQLEKRPTPSSSTQFLGSDTWFQWLKTSIGVTSLSAITTPDAKNIKGFGLELKPSNSSDTVLHFTTDAFPSALGLTLPSSNGAPYGLPGNGETLIFGLDPSSSGVGMTLPEVFDFAGLHDLAKVLPFLNEIKLQLDGPTHRNAIWFEPKNSYKTVIRLQFVVPIHEIHKFFTERLLNQTKGPQKKVKGTPPHTLELTAAHVVVKKTLREMGWQPDRSRFSMEVNVTLVAKCTIKLPKASIDFSVALTFYPRAFGFDLVPLGTNAFDNVLTWLATMVGLDDFHAGLETVKSALGIETFDITRISLTFAQLKPIYLRLELKVVHQQAVFLFSYTWGKGGGGKLKAELWPSEYPPPLLNMWGKLTDDPLPLRIPNVCTRRRTAET